VLRLRIARTLLVCALPVVAACAGGNAAFRNAPLPKRGRLVPIQRAREVAPPAVYAKWWAKTEACSGKKGKMSRVRFFAVDDAKGWIHLGDQRALAWWVREGNRIYLPKGGLRNEMLVRHEMLHALTQQAKHGHKLFAERCHVASPKTWADSTLKRDPDNPDGA
jgi:hypothetical protein